MDIHSPGLHTIGASAFSPSSVGHPTYNAGDFEAGSTLSLLIDNIPAAPALPLHTGSGRLHPGMNRSVCFIICILLRFFCNCMPYYVSLLQFMVPLLRLPVQLHRFADCVCSCDAIVPSSELVIVLLAGLPMSEQFVNVLKRALLSSWLFLFFPAIVSFFFIPFVFCQVRGLAGHISVLLIMCVSVVVLDSGTEN
jgi:hypothetical protein